MKKEIDSTAIMRSGPVKKTLLTLAVPSMIGMLASAFYNLVDTLFIGMLHDTNSMAAVSVTFPIFIILMAIGTMIGVGTSSCAGRLLGSNQHDRANRAAGISILLSIFFSIVTIVFGFIFLTPILRMMGASGDVVPYARSYGSWLLVGAPFTILNLVFNSLLRTEGAAKRSMITIIIGSFINIILDPIFMWGFHLGLAGAAIATVISQAISTILMVSFYLQKKSHIELNRTTLLKRTDQDVYIMKQIFSIGLPVFITCSFAAVATSVLNSAAETFGPAALAAMGIVSKLYTIITQLINGFSNAFLPFASYNVGANEYKRVKQGTLFSFSITFLYSFIVIALINIVPSAFIKIFSNDVQVIELGVNALKMQTYLLVGFAFISVITALFQSMGDTKKAGILSIGRQGLILIPITIILPKVFATSVPSILTHLGSYAMEPGLYGVMLAQPLSDLITLCIAIFLCKKTFQSLNQMAKAS